MKKLACCLVSFLVTIVAVVGVAFGAGAFAYNKYAKDITNISYMEAWGVLTSLYGANDKKMITNPYNKETELAQVDASMRELLYIQEGCEFSITKLIKEALAGGSTDDGDSEPSDNNQQSVANSIIGVNTSVNSNNAFMNMMADLKFDFSTLENYNGEKHILSITDKQMAAIIDDLFLNVAAGYLDDTLGQLGMTTADVISVKQANITVGEGETANNDTTVSATVKIEFGKVIKEAVTKVASGAAFLTGMLPKEIYLTFDLKPIGEGISSFTLNDNSQAQSEVLERLINGILNYSKGTKDEPQFDNFMKTIDSGVKKVFATMSDYLNIQFVSSALEMDPMQTVVRQLGLKDVTSTDMLYMISYLMQTVDELKAINWNEDTANQFFTEFKSKMPIDASVDINLDNMVTELGKIAENIDINAIDYDKTNDEMRITMNYDAFTGLINKHAFGAAGASGEADLTNGMTLKKADMSDLPNAEQDGILRFLIEIDLKKLSGVDTMQEGLVKNLLTAMLKDNVFVELDVAVNDGATFPGKILINGMSEDKSKHMLKVLDLVSKALMPNMAGQFNEEALFTKVNQAVKKGLDQIKGDENIGALDISFAHDGVRMQSIYEILKTRKNITELTAEEIRLALAGVNDNADFADGSNIVGEFDTALPIADLVNMKVGISDAYLAEQAKDKVAGVNIQNGNVQLSQLIFADLSNEVQRQAYGIYNNAGLNAILTDNGMIDKKVMFATVKISLTNDIFTKDIYVSVIKDLAAPGKTEILVNRMNNHNSRNLQLLITKLTGIELNLDTVASDVVTSIMEHNISININAGGQQISLNKTIGDIVNTAEIMPITASEKGVGKFLLGIENI